MTGTKRLKRKREEPSAEKKFVGFNLPTSLISRMKHHLADHGGTQSEFVEEAITEKLK